MSRFKLLILWLLCMMVSPILLTAMFFQAIAGSPSRALNMAAAYDQCGNALLGGSEIQTISARTGYGVVEGLRWAKIVAPCIDFFFGKGHCASYVITNKEENK